MLASARKNIRVLWSSAIFSYKGLLTWLEPRNYIGMKFIVPLLQMSFFAYVTRFASGEAAMHYAILGNVVQLASINAVLAVAMAVGLERSFGTLHMILMTPANRLAMFVGRSLSYIADGVTTALVGLFYAIFLFGFKLELLQIPVLIGILLITTFSLSGFGLLIGSLSLYTTDVVSLSNLVYFALLILCGANFPITALPEIMQILSKGIPLTYGIEAVRVLVSSSDLATVTQLVTAELILGVLQISIGCLFFIFFEKRGRRKGSLEVL